MGSGVQSSFDRKSKEEEGGSETSTKGKEDSSNITCVRDDDPIRG
jgi:hypothetical protein